MALKRIILASILSLLFFSGSAYAEEIKARYAVYASGFKVLTADFRLIQNEDTYKVVLDTETGGFLGMIVPWEGVFETDGLRAACRVRRRNDAQPD